MRLPIFAIAVIVVAISMWIRKLVLKKRLRDGLGREVKDRELTSITSWMNTTDKSQN